MNANSLTFEVREPICKKNNMAVGRGRMFKNSDLESYEQMLFWTIKNAMMEQKWNNTTSPIKVDMLYRVDDDTLQVTLTELPRSMGKSKKDIQNLQDAIMDVLESPRSKKPGKWKAGAIRNDNQCKEIRIVEV